MATNLSLYGVEDASQAPDVVARRQATVKAKYGVDNLFQSEEIKARSRATMLDRYGVEHNDYIPESNAKRKATCMARHGAENPFASESVRERIRESMLERHGAENPQQVPEIRARTKATNEERYEGELLGSPVIRAKAEVTNLERYGAAFAGGTPEVQAKVVATNLARYGVPHTCMDPEVRRKQLETHHARYGTHWFASEEGKEEIRHVLVEKYGVDHWMKTPGAWDRVLTTFKVNFPDLAWPGMLARPKSGMNGLEAQVCALAPSPDALVYTGDRRWWRHLPKLGHYKNPDFIVPGPDPAKPKKGVTRVVEAFGDFWHSRMFTGKAPFEHESDLIDAYRDIGIDCLIVWESEVKEDPEGVRDRLAAFLETSFRPPP